jgi:hypothetical protein
LKDFTFAKHAPRSRRGRAIIAHVCAPQRGICAKLTIVHPRCTSLVPSWERSHLGSEPGWHALVCSLGNFICSFILDAMVPLGGVKGLI